MGTLIEVILPVFLVVAAGYVAVWARLFSTATTDALMVFAQSFAVPVLLFRAISSLDLGAIYDVKLMASFYTGAFAGFLAGLIGARFLFGRPWTDAVAVGFATLFSNSVLLGLPITERAYGADALGPNFAIVSVHAPFCYLVGVSAMELARAGGRGAGGALLSILRSLAKNPLVIAIALGFGVNLSGLTMPGVADDALAMIARAALPLAQFALGGVLVQYRPEGDLKLVIWIAAVSLVLHPGVVWLMGRALALESGAFRSAVLTAAMAPGVNAYIFANMYGVAKRVAATAVLTATALSVLSVWVWLGILG